MALNSLIGYECNNEEHEEARPASAYQHYPIHPQMKNHQQKVNSILDA